MIATAIEVLDLLYDFKQRGYTIKVDRAKNTNIAKLARGSVMEFPCIVSNSLGIQEVLMVNKALERQYMTYVRLAMSVDDVLDSNMSKRDYINKFHSNDRVDDKDIANRMSKNLLSDTLSEDYSIFSENTLDDILLYQEAETNKELKKPERNSGQMVSRYLIDPSKSPFSKQLLDNDIKKANEMVPSTIDITVYRPEQGYDHILIGIKTITHSVNSDEMILNLSTTLREKRNFFRFVQWTTGEIKFMKDYVLSIDRQKKEALSSRNQSHWWRRLKVKANVSKLKGLIGNSKDRLIPNASLVMSMDEVEYLNNLYDIDLMNTKNAQTLIETYFLLGFVIVDPASELCYFLFDDDSRNYQTYSFSALERENSNPQRDLKGMLSLLGR